MNVLIVGLGSIAKKHIKVLKEIHPNISIYALRSSPESQKLEGIFDIYDWHQIQNHNFHFALISSPSNLHLEHTKKLWNLGIPLMIEKPLFITKNQIEEFQKLEHNQSITYIASNFRFHSLLEFTKDYLAKVPDKINEVNSYCGSYLPNWRPDQDYRQVYSAREQHGGGVHLDLIHEPDYLVYLFGLPKKSIRHNRKVSNLEITSTDSAYILFHYGLFNAQITLNYYRKDTKRTLEIIREEDSLLIDFVKGSVTNLVTNEVLFEDANFSIYSTYKKQMQYFLDCIENSIEPMNSPNEAIEILESII